jgi:hypothetical protein
MKAWRRDWRREKEPEGRGGSGGGAVPDPWRIHEAGGDPEYARYVLLVGVDDVPLLHAGHLEFGVPHIQHLQSQVSTHTCSRCKNTVALLGLYKR